MCVLIHLEVVIYTDLVMFYNKRKHTMSSKSYNAFNKHTWDLSSKGIR